MSDISVLSDDVALAVQVAEQLPELTDSQMVFVLEYSGGATGADAYRTAYNVKTARKASVWVAVARLKDNVKIRRWLSAMREAGVEKGAVTLQNHVSELERLKNFAISVGNAGAAVKAEELRGKCAGHYIVNHIHHHDMSLEGLVNNIGTMFGDDFKVAAMQKLGIKDVTPPLEHEKYDEYDDLI